MWRGGLPHGMGAVKFVAIAVVHCCSPCPLCFPEAMPWRIQFSGSGVGAGAGAGVWERQPSSHDHCPALCSCGSSGQLRLSSFLICAMRE